MLNILYCAPCNAEVCGYVCACVAVTDESLVCVVMLHKQLLYFLVVFKVCYRGKKIKI